MISDTKEDLNTNTIVLDTGLLASILANPDFLVSIGMTPRASKIFTNRGYIKSNMMGLHEKLKAWFNPKSIANFLSLSHAATKHRVVMDS